MQAEEEDNIYNFTNFAKTHARAVKRINDSIERIDLVISKLDEIS